MKRTRKAGKLALTKKNKRKDPRKAKEEAKKAAAANQTSSMTKKNPEIKTQNQNSKRLSSNKVQKIYNRKINQTNLQIISPVKIKTMRIISMKVIENRNKKRVIQNNRPMIQMTALTTEK